MMADADAKSQAPRRVTVEFTPDAFETLEELRLLTHSTSMAAVIRDALRIYWWAVSQNREGYTIAAILEEGNLQRIREITLPTTF